MSGQYYFPQYYFILSLIRTFPGGPLVKTLPSNAGHTGSIPGQGAGTLHAS